jgi:hypothetical protein
MWWICVSSGRVGSGECAEGPGQQLAQRRQQHTISRPQARPTDLPPEHLQLMSKNEDLYLLRPLVATEENQQLEQPSNGPVQKEQASRAC